MPPRPPPSPPVLTALSVLAVVGVTWVTIGLEQLVRGGTGALLGVPYLGLQLTAFYVPVVRQGGSAGLGPLASACMALAGAAALVILALTTQAAIGSFRTRGWLQSAVLEWAVLALLWMPTALAAAATPGGGGPVGELYARLGEPQAGRWTAAGLALVLLWLLAGAASRRIVATGRRWMRTDGLEFRRKLVRVAGAWPAAAAIVAVCVTGGWMSAPWLAGWVVVVFVALVVRTQ